MNFLDSELIFIPLGGSGEIGMNANLYHYQSDWLMIDLGISFSDETTPGVDIILPDIRFAEEQKVNIKAIILTHAHEDHFGAVPYLWEKLNVPIYGTPFTIALLSSGQISTHVYFFLFSILKIILPLIILSLSLE